MVLPSFPWRASSFVPDGPSGTFFPCPRRPRCWPVYSSVLAVLVGALHIHGFAQFSMARDQFASPTGVGLRFPRVLARFTRFGPCTRTWTSRCRVHGFAQFSMAPGSFVPDGRRTRFFRVPVVPVLARVLVTWTSRCRVHGFAQFSMARDQFRPRRPSDTFFPCPRRTRFGPCTRPWTSRCTHIHGGFAQFSMARTCQFRPRRASDTFFARCPRRTRFSARVLVRGPTGRCLVRWFCPVFHGATCSVCPRRPLGHVFFPCTRPTRFWPVYSYVAESVPRSVVLPSFPWRPASFVPDGRRARFFPCTRPYPFWPVYSFVDRVGASFGGFAQFSLAPVQFRPRRPSGTFFSRVPVVQRCWPVYSFVPVRRCLRFPRTWFCPVLAVLVALHIQFRPRRNVGHVFCPCPRPTRFGPCTRTWTRPWPSLVVLPSFPWRPGSFVPRRASDTFFARVPVLPVLARVLVRGRPSVPSLVVLPSFPWRDFSCISDGNGPALFARVLRFLHVSGPCTCHVFARVCAVVSGFHCISMGICMAHIHGNGPDVRRSPFSPFSPDLPVFSPVLARFSGRVTASSMGICTAVIHGERAVSSRTCVGHFSVFSVLPGLARFSPVLARFTWPRHCIVHGYLHSISM